MALIDYGGFGDGQLGGVGGTDVSIVSTDPRTGGYNAFCSGFSSYLNLSADVDADGDSFIFGGAIRVEADALMTDFFRIRQGASFNYLVISKLASGALQVGLDNSFGGTPSVILQTTSAGVLEAGAWRYLEVEWFSSPTVGIIRLRVDGEAPSGWTDIETGDTENSASTETTYEVRIHTQNANDVELADWYLADSSGADNNALLGPVKIPYSVVDSSTSSDWVGSDTNSVDNHLLLDETPTDVTDYVESSTVTDRDVYGHAGVGLTGTPIAARVLAYAVDSDGGSQNVEYGIVSGAAETVETIATPSAEGQIRGTFILVDPDGGGALTTANLDAMELAIEVVA